MNAMLKKQFLANLPPEYYDAKVLPGKRILLSDATNQEIRMFDIEGKHTFSYTCGFRPVNLAVMDRDTVAVTTYQSIEILEVGAAEIKLKVSIPTNDKRYKAVAAIDSTTLALGFWETPGIVVIDITAPKEIHRLEKVSTEMGYPISMVATPDGCLVCSNFIDTVVKIKSDTGETVLSKEVHYNRGIAVDQNGNVFWTERDRQRLHLILYDNEAGTWTKDLVLWEVPKQGHADELWGVDVRDGICVCATKQGCVFILDLKFMS
ncbi:hypothetical protein PoB_003181000 [Plakobranchus ocellatus]|uniref:Uncharacterized protein n=1 Tax=Plakobranchus ocellatus TaxID=259542 RepID=A0AAV4AAU2_9GAST|nr:hypothetical protein PoB_003181000 [Plakobranchus ocellatus]